MELADVGGIDIICTGHEHSQTVWAPTSNDNFLKPTAVIISGGGGGITSEGIPSKEGKDDQYGFMDLTLTRGAIKIEAISHGGYLRSTTTVLPRQRRVVLRRRTAEVGREGSVAAPTSMSSPHHGQHARNEALHSNPQIDPRPIPSHLAAARPASASEQNMKARRKRETEVRDPYMDVFDQRNSQFVASTNFSSDPNAKALHISQDDEIEDDSVNSSIPKQLKSQDHSKKSPDLVLAEQTNVSISNRSHIAGMRQISKGSVHNRKVASSKPPAEYV